jgi:hypothetical protein
LDDGFGPAAGFSNSHPGRALFCDPGVIRP